MSRNRNWRNSNVESTNVSNRNNTEENVLGINQRRRDPDPNNTTSLCRQFAQILEATIIESENGLCVVSRRRDVDTGLEVVNPIEIDAFLSFQRINSTSQTLNLGETVLLGDEVEDFVEELRESEIMIIALHRVFLFEGTEFWYINFFSVEDPLAFARKVDAAFDEIEED